MDSFTSTYQSKYSRASLLSRMRERESWDMLVIGGGATGLGIALEACTRGYSVLLLEQADFAKGTSSRSTKLVHGGVRYLAQGDIGLVREASVERGLLLRNAPHLVRNLSFVVPVYSWFDRFKYGIGLKLYDWMAGRLSLGSSYTISKGKLLQANPGIKEKGLKGAIVYHDGQFDDARLAINLAQTIVDQGAVAINYMPVISLTKDPGGKISGAIAQDRETGDEWCVKAKVVINATGVFVDNILQMDQPGTRPTVTVSQGIHLVVDRKFFPSDNALMIPKTSDGRVLFAVPWHGRLVMGTTDTPVGEASLEPVALEKEVDFILKTARQYLAQPPQRSDVLSVFAGLRPLAAPKEGKQKTKEISRSHKIKISPSGLFTMLGGKWTTYRKMGQDMIDRIEAVKGWNTTKTATTHLPIHGAKAGGNFDDPLNVYGADAEYIQGMMEQEGDWLSEKLKIHSAQVNWAVKNEMARTVEDVLSRRTRAIVLDVEEARRIAPKVARLMADTLHRDEAWVAEQLQQFELLCKNYSL